jgi:hypothetical protein
MAICWTVDALRIWRIAIWPSVSTRACCRSGGSACQTGRDNQSLIAGSKPVHHGTQRLETESRRLAESCQIISGVLYGISNSCSG